MQAEFENNIAMFDASQPEGQQPTADSLIAPMETLRVSEVTPAQPEGQQIAGQGGAEASTGGGEQSSSSDDVVVEDESGREAGHSEEQGPLASREAVPLERDLYPLEAAGIMQGLDDRYAFKIDLNTLYQHHVDIKTDLFKVLDVVDPDQCEEGSTFPGCVKALDKLRSQVYQTNAWARDAVGKNRAAIVNHGRSLIEVKDELFRFETRLATVESNVTQCMGNIAQMSSRMLQVEKDVRALLDASLGPPRMEEPAHPPSMITTSSGGNMYTVGPQSGVREAAAPGGQQRGLAVHTPQVQPNNQLAVNQGAMNQLSGQMAGNAGTGAIPRTAAPPAARQTTGGGQGAGGPTSRGPPPLRLPSASGGRGPGSAGGQGAMRAVNPAHPPQPRIAQPQGGQGQFAHPQGAQMGAGGGFAPPLPPAQQPGAGQQQVAPPPQAFAPPSQSQAHNPMAAMLQGGGAAPQQQFIPGQYAAGMQRAPAGSSGAGQFVQGGQGAGGAHGGQQGFPQPGQVIQGGGQYAPQAGEGGPHHQASYDGPHQGQFYGAGAAAGGMEQGGGGGQGNYSFRGPEPQQQFAGAPSSGSGYYSYGAGAPSSFGQALSFAQQSQPEGYDHGDDCACSSCATLSGY